MAETGSGATAAEFAAMGVGVRVGADPVGFGSGRDAGAEAGTGGAIVNLCTGADWTASV